MGMADREDRAFALDAFRERYPIDAEAFNYFCNTPVDVQQRVLRDFKPRSEGEDDYSALLIAFTKRCRERDGQASAAAASAPQPPWTVRSVTLSPAPRAAAAGGAGAAAGIPVSAPARSPPWAISSQLQGGIELLRRRFPIDDDAYNYLVNSSAEVQARVLRDFRPKQEGESDYSALLISFAKKCRQSALQDASTEYTAKVGPQPTMQRRPDPHERKRDREMVVGSDAQQLKAKMDTFVQRYPVDEDAWNFLMSSPPEVQNEFLANFRPKREGEQDYSALVIAFCQRCRADHDRRVVPAPHEDVPWKGGRVGGLWWGRGPAATAAVAATVTASGGPCWEAPPQWSCGHSGGFLMELLEQFCERFPIDDRAYRFLMECRAEVLRTVIESFVPPRLDDANYSAAVVAWAKVIRHRFGDAVTGPAHQGAATLVPAPWGGCGGGLGTGCDGGSVSPGPFIAAFFQRYPSDEPTQSYLCESPPEVVSRVLREFRPKREGDSDYSAAVVAYVARCRRDAGEPPRKRQRSEYL